MARIAGSGSLIRLGWSMRRAHASEASGLGFDHGAEVVAALGALLLQVLADRGEIFSGRGFVEHVPPAACAHGRVGIECRPGRVGRQHRSFAFAQRGGTTGPAPGGRFVGDAGTYRIEFDVKS